MCTVQLIHGMHWAFMNPMIRNCQQSTSRVLLFSSLSVTGQNKWDEFNFFFSFNSKIGTAHCANMYEPKDTDFPQLKEAREKIRQFLHALIADEETLF